MHDTLKEVYITMLSKNINWGIESRVLEARWILTELSVPMHIEIVESEWTEWAKWTGE